MKEIQCRSKINNYHVHCKDVIKTESKSYILGKSEREYKTTGKFLTFT